MKFNYNFLSLILVLFCLIKLNNTLRLSLTKADDFQLDDKEIENMLKDPKFANIAGDLNKLKSSRAQMAATGAELKNLGVDLNKNSLDKKEDISPPKELLSRHLKPSGLKADLEKPKQSSDNSEDILSKLGGDALKDLGLDTITKNTLVENNNNNIRFKKDESKEPVDDRFKNIDFLSKQQARLILEILKQPSFFNLLPQDAQQIVKSITDGFTFKTEENNKINDFIESTLVNSPNSQTFVDPDGIIGRKGILTILDPETGDSRFVWSVSNAKVLSFFQSQSFLTIVKLFRNSTVKIKDVYATPCFMISNNKDAKDGSLLVCSTSIQEKEVWVQTIKANIGIEN